MATGSTQYLEFLLAMGVRNILISQIYPEPWKCKNILKHHKIKVLCDSGAFTSWNLAQRKKREGDVNWEKYLVNLDNYMKFIRKYEEIIDRAVNLDIIPGEQGQPITEEQSSKAAEKGWQNYLTMKSNGFAPIHVYHQGEKIQYLERMINEGLDYIGISPSNDKTDDQKIMWLDHVFRYITDSKNPEIKTHAFGVTSYRILSRYPWTSVDSSSYSLTAAMGSILTPYGRVYVSDTHLGNPDHINNRPKQIYEHINNYLKERIGYDINSMMNTSHYRIHTCSKCGAEHEIAVKSQAYKARNYANIAYFLDIEKKVNEEGPTMDFLKQKTLFTYE